VATIWIAKGYCPPLSDPSSRTDRYHRFAAELVERGHQVVLFAADLDRWKGRGSILDDGEVYRDETVGGLIVRAFRARPYSSVLQRFISMVAFERVLLKNHHDLPAPDVVVGAFIPPFTAHAMQILAGRHDVPFILELGDIWPQTLVDLEELTKWHPVYWLLRALEVRLFRQADRVLTKLPMAGDHIAAAGGNPESVIWLPNAVIMDPFLAPDYPLSPPASDEFTVLYAGGLVNSYGLENLIDAARIVAKRKPDLPIKFHLRGAGNRRDQLIAYAKGATNVLFPDRVPHEDLPAIYADADVLVVMFRELGVIRKYGTSANKIYEYLGAGRPIVFSVASANDPIAEAGAGISVPPENPQAIADAVIELYCMRPDERLEMGRRARKYAMAGFTMEQMSERFARVIEETLAGQPAGTLVPRFDLVGSDRDAAKSPD
jgi:glycosyltransferase involved in cell wall biosynthesis